MRGYLGRSHHEVLWIRFDDTGSAAAGGPPGGIVGRRRSIIVSRLFEAPHGLERPSPMATQLQRASRILPYFRQGRAGMVVAALASLVAALTEPALPALMKP